MIEHTTYTKEEVKKNIDILTIDMDELIEKRKHLTVSINEKKKQIKYWEELDLSQYKAF